VFGAAEALVLWRRLRATFGLDLHMPPRLLCFTGGGLFETATACTNAFGRSEMHGDAGRETAAAFTADLLNVRMRTLGHPTVEYEFPGGSVGDAETFRVWCSSEFAHSGVRGVRIRGTLTKQGARMSVTTMAEIDAEKHRAALAGFRGAIARSIQQAGEETVVFTIEGGDVRISGADFLTWLDTFDIGDIGHIRGTWMATESSKEHVFLISARVPALSEALEFKPRNILTRVVWLPLLRIVRRWIPREAE
jgi:hypothetical protein